jgi:putative ABC transport system ATP-binding protein
MTGAAPPTPVRTSGTAAAAVDAVKIYGRGDTEVHALAGVTVELGAGRFTAIMGPSGSGKSTLMHCLAGLDTLTSGHVHIGDTEVSGLDDKRLTLLRRDRIGFVFQAFNLIPTLSALENITLPMALAGAILTPPGSITSSTPSACATGSVTVPRSSPAASSSGWPWPAPSPGVRRSSSPTSRPATSTPAPAPRSSTSCAGPCAGWVRPW